MMRFTVVVLCASASALLSEVFALKPRIALRNSALLLQLQVDFTLLDEPNRRTIATNCNDILGVEMH